MVSDLAGMVDFRRDVRISLYHELPDTDEINQQSNEQQASPQPERRTDARSTAFIMLTLLRFAYRKARVAVYLLAAV